MTLRHDEIPEGGAGPALPPDGGPLIASVLRGMRRTDVRALVANAGWLVADRASRLGIGLVVNIWIARYLGPADFGLFNYAQAIAAIFAFAATLGLPDILIRDLIGDPARRRAMLASAFVLRTVGAFVVFGLCMMFVIVSRPGDPAAWFVMAMLASGQIAQAMDVVDTDYQSRNTVRRIVLLRNANFMMFSILKVAAILSGFGLATFAALYAAELFVIAALLYWTARLDGFEFALSDTSRVEIRRLLVEVRPQILRLAMIGVYLRVDQILIGQLLGDTQVGLYTAATRLMDTWYMVITAVMLAVAPRLSHTFHHARDKYQRQLTMVVRIVAWASIALAAALSVLAPFVIDTLYGPQFAGAAPVLIIHAWAGVFSSIGQTSNGALVNQRLLHLGAYQAVAGAVVNIAVCLALIPTLGIVGGALAAVATQAVTGMLLNLCFRETRPLFRMQIRALFFGRAI